MSSGKKKKKIAAKRSKPVEPKRPVENFEVDLREVTVQIPALAELESLALELTTDEDAVLKLKNPERFIEILDPKKWVELFPVSIVENYRDIDELPLIGRNYDQKMQTVFNRFLNPVGHAFARVVSHMQCEALCCNGTWAQIYEVLASWNGHKHWFIYLTDPFQGVDTEKDPLERLDPNWPDSSTDPIRRIEPDWFSNDPTTL